MSSIPELGGYFENTALPAEENHFFEQLTPPDGSLRFLMSGRCGILCALEDWKPRDRKRVAYVPAYTCGTVLAPYAKPGNRSFFANEEADALIMEGRSQSDIEKRKEIYSQLNQVIYENCTQLFICHPTNSYSMSNKVDGFILNKDGYNRLNYVTCLQ